MFHELVACHIIDRYINVMALHTKDLEMRLKP